MTATAIASPATTPTQRGRVTPARAVRAEWVKLFSLRSSWITLAVAVVAVIGLGTLFSFVTSTHWSELRPQERLRFDPVGVSLRGVMLAQLVVGVLGALVITGEYATGMIRSSLMAVPRRLPVLVAKAVVFAGVTFVLMLVSAFVAFFAGQAALGSHGTTLGAGHALRPIVGVALYLTVVALFALGLGFALRNTAGTIATVFGLLLVVPGLAELLPTTWQPHVLPYLPSNAGASVFAVQPEAGMLGVWTGFAVFCAWAAAALVLGALVLKRRDA
jgi:ABC-type transport system involved in multi-copper enzyme maturation permease subunit